MLKTNLRKVEDGSPYTKKLETRGSVFDVNIVDAPSKEKESIGRSSQIFICEFECWFNLLMDDEWIWVNLQRSCCLWCRETPVCVCMLTLRLSIYVLWTESTVWTFTVNRYLLVGRASSIQKYAAYNHAL